MDKKSSKVLPLPEALSSCDATCQMLKKARKDGVTLALDRAVDMKHCPIGVEYACCKHCYMGPCRLNTKMPYAKVGVCGATIDASTSRWIACGLGKALRSILPLEVSGKFSSKTKAEGIM